MALLPGPSIDFPSPTKRSATIQASGGSAGDRAGAYGAGGSAASAARATTLRPGCLAMSAIASSVPRGAGPRGGVASANSAAQRDAARTQGTSRFASELTVRHVEVVRPFGGRMSTGAASPVRGSARFAAIVAAFRGPGDGPAIPAALVNWASANPAATVVRSLTTTRPGSAPDPSTAASRTALPRPTVRYATLPEPGGS